MKRSKMTNDLFRCAARPFVAEFKRGVFKVPTYSASLV